MISRSKPHTSKHNVQQIQCAKLCNLFNAVVDDFTLLGKARNINYITYCCCAWFDAVPFYTKKAFLQS